jgi:hypothetical protein
MIIIQNAGKADARPGNVRAAGANRVNSYGSVPI